MAYLFFKDAMAKFGDKICIIGEVSRGNFEIILQMVGFQALPVLLKKNRAYIQKLIKYNEEYTMKTQMAIMDAGVKVLLKGDDMAYKTGPILNPKLIDELFGDFYTKYTKAVHDRGGRVMIHSCGDNTKLFDYFIKWGFDGGHAYENTSKVDIFREKEIHGDVFTIVGGVGIDYLLTPRSKPEEVEEKVIELIKRCGPGGRFLIGPIHDHPDMDMEKVRVMIEAAQRYGKYPISI
jgi:uroporphyrinogen decarboxylase